MTLIDKILKTQGDNLLEKILSYCEMNDLNPQKIGDVLSDHEQFKNELWFDCVKNNIIQDEELKIKNERTENIEEW